MKKRIAWVIFILILLCMIGSYVLAEEENERLYLTEETMEPVMSQLLPAIDHELIYRYEPADDTNQSSLPEDDNSGPMITYTFENDAKVQIRIDFDEDELYSSFFQGKVEEVESLFIPYYHKDRNTGELFKDKYPVALRAYLGNKSYIVKYIPKDGITKTETLETDSPSFDVPTEETDPNDVEMFGLVGGSWFIRPEKINEDHSVAAWSFEIESLKISFVGTNSAWDSLETCFKITQSIQDYLQKRR